MLEPAEAVLRRAQSAARCRARDAARLGHRRVVHVDAAALAQAQRQNLGARARRSRRTTSTCRGSLEGECGRRRPRTRSARNHSRQWDVGSCAMAPVVSLRRKRRRSSRRPASRRGGWRCAVESGESAEKAAVSLRYAPRRRDAMAGARARLRASSRMARVVAPRHEAARGRRGGGARPQSGAGLPVPRRDGRRPARGRARSTARAVPVLGGARGRPARRRRRDRRAGARRADRPRERPQVFWRSERTPNWPRRRARSCLRARPPWAGASCTAPRSRASPSRSATASSTPRRSRPSRPRLRRGAPRRRLLGGLLPPRDRRRAADARRLPPPPPSAALGARRRCGRPRRRRRRHRRVEERGGVSRCRRRERARTARPGGGGGVAAVVLVGCAGVTGEGALFRGPARRVGFQRIAVVHLVLGADSPLCPLSRNRRAWLLRRGRLVACESLTRVVERAESLLKQQLRTRMETSRDKASTTPRGDMRCARRVASPRSTMTRWVARAVRRECSPRPTTARPAARGRRADRQAREPARAAGARAPLTGQRAQPRKAEMDARLAAEEARGRRRAAAPRWPPGSPRGQPRAHKGPGGEQRLAAPRQVRPRPRPRPGGVAAAKGGGRARRDGGAPRRGRRSAARLDGARRGAPAGRQRGGARARRRARQQDRAAALPRFANATTRSAPRRASRCTRSCSSRRLGRR